MKGSIFIALNEMVEEVAGMAAWDAALSEVNPDSGGIYTSVDTYPDEELFALVDTLSSQLNIPFNDLVRMFGVNLFAFLNSRYPMYVESADSLFTFLESINNDIHKEVQILYPSAYLPAIDCKRISDLEVEMHYASRRKLCVLAEGLVMGAAKQFGKNINFKHELCMHDGNDHCEFRIIIVG